MLLLLPMHTLQGLEVPHLQELPSLLLESHHDLPPLLVASMGMGPRFLLPGRCMVAIMAIMENTMMVEQLILRASTHLILGIQDTNIIRMVCIGAEQMLGMADIKDNRQLIEIQITHTENLNQNDPAPELVSTLTGPLTGPLPGKAILKTTTEQTQVPTVIIM